ncbi:hypothetical protein FA15DRAFT_692732 [Coprinopsis marcescibilis]|jgi:hypothetical protein|uniref:Uncharacterized protein n=1 Tax=Coprinopsis marcescibilis TaxID=230819 RepID=A0A5C3L4F9_COPMA|nr:hypothetical protein FA15DRAFT_692732 [Coprinopsis marcescibilis]
MTYPWRTIINDARSYMEIQSKARRNIVEARAEPKQLSQEDITSVALGVTFSVVVLALIAFGIWYFIIRPRRRAVDIEAGSTEKRNWWMVDSKEKSGVSDWWRKSYAAPDRVEPPPSAGPRSSLKRLRSALTRKGALKGTSSGALLIPKKVTVTSPTYTIDLPMQTEPSPPPALPPKPRYPSILDRSYRVPLYPTQAQPQDASPPRSLTSPAPQHPIMVAELNVRRKVSLPPRALKIANGRPFIQLSERKMGLPRSPAHHRKGGLMGQFKHPFMPLKDSDTAFPTISAPMPCTETEATNPKLGYAYAASLTQPRVAPTPTGPRVARSNTRRVPAPVYVGSAPQSRSLMPATPRHLRDDSRVFPPGQSPTVRSPMPAPI